ncbi:MAG: hypothetical protein JNL83_40085 [Myxococcales bacterium]|nr:hypothetical protein [Myxococcales bacterium]
MRLRRPVTVAGTLLFLAATTAHAVNPRSAPAIAAEELTALPAAKLPAPLRTHADVRWAKVPSAAWTRFEQRMGGRWSASYDRATGVPNRIWGSGYATPGAVALPQVAEGWARSLLRDHLALLAPGARVEDFVLVANHSDGEIRSVGFAQQFDGRRVVGGQVSFRFKRDRLIAIGSEALPEVAVDTTSIDRSARLSRADVGQRAKARLRAAVALPAAPITEPGDEVVLPLVADDAILGYRVARPLTIDGGAEGKYLAYADAATGEVLAVKQLNAYASGTVRYKSVDRHPGRPRVDRPAQHAHVMVAGARTTTALDGSVSWGPDAAQTLTTAVSGNFVEVVNQAAGGQIAFAELSISPGGSVLWDPSANVDDDAQVQVYIATNIVKDYVRTMVDPNMKTLDEVITANVNLGQDCNAFYDGRSINFFHRSAKCQNTGLLQDVVYHEFGHALHSEEVIEGVGKFDGAMSEGASDFLAASITGDPGMGRGFFFNDDPLRSLDPLLKEFVWPDDVQEIHHTGLIYGGTFWDLRKALIAELGESDGITLTNKLYVGTLRRASSIPSSLIEALVEDDDDGNLDNGTPHECTIRRAFGRHGLRTVTGTIVAPATVEQKSEASQVRVELTGIATRCTGDNIIRVVVTWKGEEGRMGPEGTADAVQGDLDTYYALIPLPENASVFYKARIIFEDSSVLTLADNLADPYYQLYQGTTKPLYCTSFEDGDPLTMGWTTGASKDASPWAWGEPMGGTSDPQVAFSGTHILAQELGGNYKGDRTSWVEMPTIDVGKWSDVRLQYRRWLGVEDGHFDKARIRLNGKEVWINATQNIGDSSSLAHLDREWRFHDVPLSGKVPGHDLTVRWELSADTGLAYGGWQLDDVCIVANISSVCGDGVKSPTEACDDGASNANTAGACRTYCQLPTCGDFIVDEGEDCDRGLEGDGTCTASCTDIEIPSLGGCCSTGGGGAAGSFALGALVGAVLLRRRRQRG